MSVSVTEYRAGLTYLHGSLRKDVSLFVDDATHRVVVASKCVCAASHTWHNGPRCPGAQ